jgi:hypothetical protein
VSDYLVGYIEQHGVCDPRPWVAEETLRRVEKAEAGAEDGGLRPSFDALGGEVPYDQIRICMVCLRNGRK